MSLASSFLQLGSGSHHTACWVSSLQRTKTSGGQSPQQTLILLPRLTLQCPLQEFLSSRGHLVRAAPGPWAEQDWSPCQVSKKAFSCGMCPGYTLMSTSNLKISGADIQSQARREGAQRGSIWSLKERLVKPVSMGRKGVGRDGKLGGSAADSYGVFPSWEKGAPSHNCKPPFLWSPPTLAKFAFIVF